MSWSFERVGVAVLAGCLVFPGAAWAQPHRRGATKHRPAHHAQVPLHTAAAAQARGPMRVNLVGMQAKWMKVCGHDKVSNKDVCYTTRDFGTAGSKRPALALAVYDVKGENVRIVRLLLPVGLLLKPGFRFAVDKGAAMAGNFDICFPNGCFAESKVNGSTIEQLKKGNSLAVAVKNQADREVTFVLPLKGFAKAFDGPAISPKVLAKRQQQQAHRQRALQEEMQKRAQAERQRLENAPGNNQPALSAPGHLTLPRTHKR